MLLPRSSFVSSFRRLRLELGAMCIAGFTICASGLFAQQEQTQGPGRSPFLPPNWEQSNRTEQQAQAPAANAEQSAYSFNGLLTIGGRTYYSVSDEQSKQAYLLEMDDKSQGVQVTGYDPARNTLSISPSGGGSVQQLSLRKSDGEPVVAANQGRNMAGQSRMRGAPGGGNTVQTSQMVTDRRGPSVEWLEARHRRLGEQIEQRRIADAQAAAGGAGSATGGSSTVRVGTAGVNSAPASGSSMSAGGGERSTEQVQNVRRRRLRLDTNAQ